MPVRHIVIPKQRATAFDLRPRMFATVDSVRNVCEKALIGGPPRTNDYCDYARQLGDLGVLRGVILGFSEEARTRGFASLALARFAFIVACYTACTLYTLLAEMSQLLTSALGGDLNRSTQHFS